MKEVNPTKEDLKLAVETLNDTERGRQTLRDLLAFITNGGDGLDIVNQCAVLLILRCQFGPYAGSTREEIKRAVGAPPQDHTKALVSVLHNYAGLLNMSDPDHEEYADSCADVVQSLWYGESEVRKLLESFPVPSDRKITRDI